MKQEMGNLGEVGGEIKRLGRVDGKEDGKRKKTATEREKKG